LFRFSRETAKGRPPAAWEQPCAPWDTVSGCMWPFFMKGDYPYGEWDALRLSDATVERFGFREFTDPNNVKPEEREQAEKALSAARKAMLSGTYDVVILDEVNVASAWKLITRMKSWSDQGQAANVAHSYGAQGPTRS